MPAYVIFIRERTRDASVFESYNPKAGASLAGHPVEVLAAYGRQEGLEGAPTEGAVLLKFPTMEAAKAWYDSPAYREARAIRFGGADYRAFIFEGLA